MKYTPELKAEALKSIESIGVVKTVKEMKITSQTLYKWRNEAKVGTKKPDVNSYTVSAKELLKNDSLLQDKIIKLESENNTLRATLTKYRVALAAVLGENNV